MAGRPPSRRLRPSAVPTAVLLDAQALTAAAQGQVRIRAELTLAERLGVAVHVSSVTLAEVLRGHRRDARVPAVLSAVDKDAVTPELGQSAGELLGRSERADTIDAIVAVTADALGESVRLLTGDPGGLRALTSHMPAVTVVPV